MAGSKCSICGATYVEQKEICPNCNAILGAPSADGLPTKVWSWAKSLLILIAIGVAIAQVFNYGTNRPPTWYDPLPGDQGEVIRPTPTGKTQPIGWRYRLKSPSHEGIFWSSAFVYSNHEVDPNPPHSGKQHAILIVRRSAEIGYELVIRLDLGDFPSHEAYVTELSITLDNGPPLKFLHEYPYRMDGAFLRLPLSKEHLGQIAASKEMQVRLRLLDQEPISPVFNTEGFDLARLTIPSQ